MPWSNESHRHSKCDKRSHESARASTISGRTNERNLKIVSRLQDDCWGSNRIIRLGVGIVIRSGVSASLQRSACAENPTRKRRRITDEAAL